MDAEQRAELRQIEEGKSERFTKWTGKSETKLMISLLPELTTDVQRDCFTTLLRSAFEAGHDAGSSDMLNSLLTRFGRGGPHR